MNPTPQQLTTAHALAYQHGHEWATLLELEDVQGLSPEQIAALVEERAPLDDDQRWMRGITAPVLHGDEVVHTTASGRLQWAVHPDGSVDLTVSRPSTPEYVRTLALAAARAGVEVPPEELLGVPVLCASVAAESGRVYSGPDALSTWALGSLDPDDVGRLLRAAPPLLPRHILAADDAVMALPLEMMEGLIDARLGLQALYPGALRAAQWAGVA